MKKAIAIMLTLAVTAGLFAGCGSNETVDSSSAGASTSSPSSSSGSSGATSSSGETTANYTYPQVGETENPAPVSYTHLDVYKRQSESCVVKQLLRLLEKEEKRREECRKKQSAF